MEQREAWYALACAQLGARATLRLLEAFQQPQAIFVATPAEWTARARVSPGGCARLVEAANRDLSGELARLDREHICLLTFHDDDYPGQLRTIPDPPAVLFTRGTLTDDDARAIAIVGSRRASPYGRHVASELAAELARQGFTIVSGLALGADAAAHEGCLRAGGRTIGVLGCGVDVVYPREHFTLYERILVQGVILSESPPGAPPAKHSFPARNRIISGLACGVVVVEAPEKSGALITASHALEQGREVFAVPGSVNSPQSRGTHQLLRDGAKLVASIDDILEELELHIPASPRVLPPLSGPNWDVNMLTESVVPSAPPKPVARPRRTRTPSAPVVTTMPEPAPEPPPPPLPPEEETVLRLLSTTATHVDQLVEQARLSSAQVNAALLMLELKGMVQRRPGNQYIRLR